MQLILNLNYIMANSDQDSVQCRWVGQRMVCGSISSLQQNKQRTTKPVEQYADSPPENDLRNSNTDFCRIIGSPPPPYIAVISRWDENVSWVSRLPIPTLVYEHAKPNARYSVPVNKGSETSAYIKFIIDHYDCLPRWCLFLHGDSKIFRHFLSSAYSIKFQFIL